MARQHSAINAKGVWKVDSCEFLCVASCCSFCFDMLLSVTSFRSLHKGTQLGRHDERALVISNTREGSQSLHKSDTSPNDSYITRKKQY